LTLESLSPWAFAAPEDRKAVFAALEDWLGNRFSQAPAQREQHGHTLTWIENQPPEAVAFPHSADEVVRIVKLCAEKRVPIIAFGAGTSLEGHLKSAYVIITDVCVPISNLAACVKETQADIAELRLTAPIVDHVGDGNFHALPLVDLNDADEVRRAKDLFGARRATCACL
jgi:FAD/FMN-containing dehydrogenase